MSTRETRWLFDTVLASRVIPWTGTVSEWARQHVRLPGSALSAAFNPDLSPWTRPVIDAIDDGRTRKITLVKPVQTGGSVVGRIVAAELIRLRSEVEGLEWDIAERDEAS